MFKRFLGILVVVLLATSCLHFHPLIDLFSSSESEVESQEQIVVEKEIPPVTFKEEIPPVRPIFEELEIDLRRYYFTDEEIAKMEKKDKEFANPEHYGRDNQSWEFQSSKGEFLVVRSYGRESINSKARNRGGWGYSTLRLPNGTWMCTSVQIQNVLEVEEKTFWICDHGIYEFISSEKLVRVVSFEGLDGKWAPLIRVNRDSEDGFFAGYLPVNKSSGCEFGGLLEYKDGKWIFHRYEGKYNVWIEKAEKKEDGSVFLTLFNGWQHQIGTPTPQVHFSSQEGFQDL